jgi:hypothetical protein
MVRRESVRELFGGMDVVSKVAERLAELLNVWRQVVKASKDIDPFPELPLMELRWRSLVVSREPAIYAFGMAASETEAHSLEDAAAQDHGCQIRLTFDAAMRLFHPFHQDATHGRVDGKPQE